MFFNVLPNKAKLRANQILIGLIFEKSNTPVPHVSYLYAHLLVAPTTNILSSAFVVAPSWWKRNEFEMKLDVENKSR